MHKQRIIRQPDGKLALWDTANCYFTYLGLSEEEVIEAFVEEGLKELKEIAKRELGWFKRDEKKKCPPNYYMSFRKALQELEKVYGNEERDKVWGSIGKIKWKKETAKKKE
jgi:protoporphyrinogen oxidase